jgi:hypothetical protein
MNPGKEGGGLVAAANHGKYNSSKRRATADRRNAMRTSSLLLTAALLVGAGPARAADLHKVDRTIKKEPRYASKPKYCLLVFGPEARTRVWLVLDGDTLYVDRNGNGDLTDKGERFQLPRYKARHFPRQFRSVEVGELSAGGRKLGRLEVTTVRINPGLVPTSKDEKALQKEYRKLPGGTSCTVKVWDLPPATRGGKPALARSITQAAGSDSSGKLSFAARPHDAPVIHFDGPLKIVVADAEQAFVRGKEGKDLQTTVGTPGLGKGTFAFLDYQNFSEGKIEDVIPESAKPVADIEFPPKSAGGKPVRVKWVLKQRC